VDLERGMEAWRDRVLDLLLSEEKIDESVVRSMRGWSHSIDRLSAIETGEHE